MSRYRAEGDGVGQQWGEKSLLDRNRSNDFHGIQNILGIAPSEHMSAYHIAYGINVATRLLLQNIRASGSFMSTEVGKATEYMGMNSIFLKRLQPLLRRKVNIKNNNRLIKENILQAVDQTLNVVVNEGAMDMDNLSPEGYGYLKIFQGLTGANLDIHGYDTLGDHNASTNTLMALLRVGYKYIVGNGDKLTIMSLSSTFGRLKNVHITSAEDTYSGGMNFMCLPEDWIERFTTMLNMRVGQTGEIYWPEKGMKAVVDTKKIDQNIAMIGQPESEGEWLMHTARAVRVAVMHGFDEDRMDIASFETKKPLGKEMSFEAVVGVVDNLVVAHAHNPELTKKLVEKLGLHKYFDKAKLSEVENGMERADQELFGDGPVLLDDNAFNFWENRVENEYTRIQDLAGLVAMYMPVTVDEFARLVPVVTKRDQVCGEMIGELAGDEKINPRVYKSYLVRGEQMRLRYDEMEAVLALEKMIAVGRERNISEVDIAHMINDMEYLWKRANDGVSVETWMIDDVVNALFVPGELVSLAV